VLRHRSEVPARGPRVRQPSRIFPKSQDGGRRWVRGRRVHPERLANGRGAGSSSASARERQVPDSPKRRPRERRHPESSSAHFGVWGRARKDRRGREADRRRRQAPLGASALLEVGRNRRVDRGSGSRSGRSGPTSVRKAPARRLSRSTDRRMKRLSEPARRFGASRAKAIGSRRHPRERRPLPRGARASARTPRTGGTVEVARDRRNG
jgi:hypothetical protein